MRNWYCLVNFPDGTQDVRLIPGPAPVQLPGEAAPVVKITGEKGVWTVLDIDRGSHSDHHAAAIWVRPATDAELTSVAGPAPETTAE